MSEEIVEVEDTDCEEFVCWCGAKGTFESMHDMSCLSMDCGGSGYIYCYCGGDFCVCHWHGQTDCEGCPDCDPYYDEDDLNEDDIG